MRDGAILCEGQPDDLLRTTRKANLEEVFLALCHSQRGGGGEEGDGGSGGGGGSSGHSASDTPELDAIVAQRRSSTANEEKELGLLAGARKSTTDVAAATAYVPPFD